MKKRILRVSSFMFLLTILFTSFCFAANGYDFEVNYTGEIVANQEKEGDVVLIGDGTSNGYTNVLIKVDIEGPATPKLLATDSAGTQYDIAELGSWGPETGFPVPGEVRNVTQITSIFPEAGEYTITLSLIDKADNDNVITSRAFGITVVDDTPDTPPTNEITNQVNNTVENIVSNIVNETSNEIVNNEMIDNTIAELPKTGASIPEILLTILAILGVMIFATYRAKNR